MTLLDRLRAMPPTALLPVGWILGELEGSGGLQTPATPNGSKVPDRLLTPEQVAERLATTPGWVYAHWREQLPFGQKVSHRQLRFSERALERHLARRGTA